MRAGKSSEISETSARLLVCGILDNTLDFKAFITTDRDKQAYTALLTRANLPADWTARYSSECQESIVRDFAGAIGNDTKVINFQTFPSPVAVGQAIIWDVQALLAGPYIEQLRTVLAARGTSWFANLISIDEGKSYVIAHDSAVQQWLSDLLAVRFNGSVGAAGRLWLRKEIMRQDLS